MTKFLHTLFGGMNQFASGGLLLMIAGAASVYLRSVPAYLWSWALSQFKVQISVKDDDDAFEWVKEWLLEQTFLQRIRRVDLDTTMRGRLLALVPSPGHHWFWHGGRPFVVELRRGEEVKSWGVSRSESFTFRTLGRGQQILRRFVDDITVCHEKNTAMTSSLYVFADHWTRVRGYNPRLLASVVLNAGAKEEIVKDVARFKASARRYAELGVPYHRGYLFHGPPGTGKTSLASALANQFGMAVYVINLSHLTDKTLATAINGVPPGAVILFEDIDCMNTAKSRAVAGTKALQEGKAGDSEDASEGKGVTLSGLLNVLDGFSAPEDVLFIMTSNHIENLDEALLRPGRIDYRLYLGAATDRQKAELYRRFFPLASEYEALDFVEANSSAETMAEFQGLLLRLESGDLTSAPAAQTYAYSQKD